ncbi:hypothetical protein [Parahaliea mediterranea]|uniref:hypothetical protein n=1 Tax=Parahaliea mediterranea TaxID=651086 RepID=UPI000E2F1E4B|nr:hypothetical protein [Parahaliea mediterranea]
MKVQAPARRWQTQAGLVLPMALCFLLLLVLLASTASQHSALEQRLAANAQQQERLRQQAMGMVQALAEQPAHFAPGLSLGQRRCAGADGARAEGCPVSALALPALLQEKSVATSQVHIERIPSPGNPALRMKESTAFSATAFRFQLFEVYAELDNSDQRGGRAVVAMGIGRRHGVGTSEP